MDLLLIGVLAFTALFLLSAIVAGGLVTVAAGADRAEERQATELNRARVRASGPGRARESAARAGRARARTRTAA